ncbi:MAG: 2-phosphosulfolactate phosphatase [Deltaproteobacteria bacterium]|nr:2-phosphosulfolactate phosphatase [Deltaproteobacteria bacterium]
MQVSRYSGLNGARDLRGSVVILDVIRASNTVLGALDSGAREVWLVEELDEARSLKAANPQWELWGERGGVMVPGFAGDNSPALARSRDLTGVSVVLTTTNGTRAAGLLNNADPVFIGSLANAAALCEFILQLNPSWVTLLAAGHGDNSPALEDELVADHLESLLKGHESDPKRVAKAILACGAAKTLRQLGQQDDLKWCASPDISNMIAVVDAGETPRARPWNIR